MDAKETEQLAADKRAKNLQVIDDLMKDPGGYLSAWEVSFLTNIERVLKNRSNLTIKQQAVLDDLAKKAAERYD